jgi:hypothetical protein
LAGDQIEKEREIRSRHLGWMWPKSPEIVALCRNFWSLMLPVWFSSYCHRFIED